MAASAEPDVADEESGVVVRDGVLSVVGAAAGPGVDVSDRLQDRLGRRTRGLSRLTVVRLSGCRLARMPDAFWALPGLRDVDLSRNLLESAGAAFASAGAVRSMDLSHNYLQAPPPWTALLSRARVLRLNDNPMEATALAGDGVGAAFGRNCRALRIIDVSTCAARSLDRSRVFEARDLKVLVLGRRPPRSCAKTDLSAVASDLLENALSSLPRDIGFCTGLVRLVACGIKLSDLPDEIGLLANLKELDLSHNEIHWLPTTLEKLTSLEVLFLSHNFLDSLPYKIETLVKLRELHVASNQVCWITEDIGAARSNLETLDLYGNKLDLEGARPVRDLSLRELDLGANLLGLESIAEELLVDDYLSKQTRLRTRLDVVELRADLPDKDVVITERHRASWSSYSPESGDDESLADEGDDVECDVETFTFDGDPWLEANGEEAELELGASPPTFLWMEKGKKDGKDEEEEVWSSDDGVYSRTSSVERRRRQNGDHVPKYDFDDMRKYGGRGRFDLCPSDQHPRSVVGAAGYSSRVVYPSQLGRPGRRSYHTGGAMLSRRQVAGADDESGGQFEDAD